MHDAQERNSSVRTGGTLEKSPKGPKMNVAPGEGGEGAGPGPAWHFSGCSGAAAGSWWVTVPVGAAQPAHETHATGCFLLQAGVF